MSVLEPLSWSSIHLIVAEVLRHVHSLEDLKSCRLASKLWQTVADRFFYNPRKLQVRLSLRLSDDADTNRSGSSSMAVKKRHAISTWQDKVDSFGEFVTGSGTVWRQWSKGPNSKYPLSHLVIENENRLAHDIYQKICSDLLSEVGPTLTTLDIRFSSGNFIKDLNFFCDILTKAPSLTEFGINFDMWRTIGRQAFNRAYFQYPSLKKLKVNILLGLSSIFEEVFNYSKYITSANNVINAGGVGVNISTCVPGEFRPYCLHIGDAIKHDNLMGNLTCPFTNLETLSITSDYSPYGLISKFQKTLIFGLPDSCTTLRELHLEPLECFSSMALLSDACCPLTKLSLWYPEYSLTHFLPAITRHAETLTDLEIKFQPDYKGGRLEVDQVPLFPKLERLAYKFRPSSSEEEETGRSSDYDFLNLEKFFRTDVQEFSAKFPVLTEIGLELGRWKFYDQLVPNERSANPQLRQVRVTLEERDGKEYEETLSQRLASLFPSASQEVVIVPDSY